MIKQRNFNSLNDNKSCFIKDKVQSPFNRQNPYRMKAQFFSQKKKNPIVDRNTNNSITQMRKSSYQPNTQSLKYHRNYKQSPPTTATKTTKTFSSDKLLLLKDNYITIKPNLLTRNLNSMQQLQQQQYRTRLKQFVAQKFCPSDIYLDIMRDRFIYFNNQNSQFQNVMKMSNLGISKLTKGNNNNSINCKDGKTPFSTVSYKNKVNPFYRKSLLLSTQKNSKCEYVTEVAPMTTTTTTSTIINYAYSAMPQIPSHQHLRSNIYQIIIPPPSDPKHYVKQRTNSIYSQQSGSRVSNNNTVQNNQYIGLIPSMKELDTSFGVDYESKEKIHHVKPFIDAIIEERLEDPLRIQTMAPKIIRIQGKMFYLNRVYH